jgi:hypothetical protein
MSQFSGLREGRFAAGNAIFYCSPSPGDKPNGHGAEIGDNKALGATVKKPVVL